MTELEKLMKQKKEIEQQIKDLQANSLICAGMVRFEQKDPDKAIYPWQVSTQIKQQHIEYETREEAEANGRSRFDRRQKAAYDIERRQVFIREKTREKAIEQIRKMIQDLTELEKII